MDNGFTYVNRNRDGLRIYIGQGWNVPSMVKAMSPTGEVVEFHRLSDRSLECLKTSTTDKGCRNDDCHKAVIGECACGRHPNPVRFELAT